MSKRATYLALALAGGALGATVALLAAPAPGVETRRRISRWINDGHGYRPGGERHALDGFRAYYNEGVDLLADVVNG
jgi:gas vesicle protein